MFIPKIKLNGKNVINVTYKKEYKEKGAEATFLGRKLSSKVNISGKVIASGK